MCYTSKVIGPKAHNIIYINSNELNDLNYLLLGSGPLGLCFSAEVISTISKNVSGLRGEKQTKVTKKIQQYGQNPRSKHVIL